MTIGEVARINGVDSVWINRGSRLKKLKGGLRRWTLVIPKEISGK